MLSLLFYLLLLSLLIIMVALHLSAAVKYYVVHQGEERDILPAFFLKAAWSFSPAALVTLVLMQLLQQQL